MGWLPPANPHRVVVRDAKEIRDLSLTVDATVVVGVVGRTNPRMYGVGAGG